MSDDIDLVACANCSTEYNPDDLATTPSGDVLCSDCRIYCDRCEDYRWEDGSRGVEGVGIYCESCADVLVFTVKVVPITIHFGVRVAKAPTQIMIAVIT